MSTPLWLLICAASFAIGEAAGLQLAGARSVVSMANTVLLVLTVLAIVVDWRTTSACLRTLRAAQEERDEHPHR